MNLETSTRAVGFGFATFATAALIGLGFATFATAALTVLKGALLLFDDAFVDRLLPLLFDCAWGVGGKITSSSSSSNRGYLQRSQCWCDTRLSRSHLTGAPCLASKWRLLQRQVWSSASSSSEISLSSKLSEDGEDGSSGAPPSAALADDATCESCDEAGLGLASI